MACLRWEEDDGGRGRESKALRACERMRAAVSQIATEPKTKRTDRAMWWYTVRKDCVALAGAPGPLLQPSLLTNSFAEQKKGRMRYPRHRISFLCQ